MDDFLHNLRNNNKNKNFNQNRKHFENPNYKSPDRKNIKDRKGDDSQRILTSERMMFFTRVLDDLLNAQKTLAEISEKRLAVEERIALALEQLAKSPMVNSGLISDAEFRKMEEADPKSTASDTESPKEKMGRKEIHDLICHLREQDLSFREIAQDLRERNIPTFSGKGDWRIQTIAKICKQWELSRDSQDTEAVPAVIS